MTHYKYRDLINADGTVNHRTYRAIVRRRAISNYGSVTPRSLRGSRQFIRDILSGLQAEWKTKYGIAQPMSPLADDLAAPLDGVQRET